jgi:hypothetical protein
MDSDPGIVSQKLQTNLLSILCTSCFSHKYNLVSAILFPQNILGILPQPVPEGLTVLSVTSQMEEISVK